MRNEKLMNTSSETIQDSLNDIKVAQSTIYDNTVKHTQTCLDFHFPWVLVERHFYCDKIYGGYTHAPYLQKKWGLVLPPNKDYTSWRILYYRGKDCMYMVRWTGFKIIFNRK